MRFAPTTRMVTMMTTIMRPSRLSSSSRTKPLSQNKPYTLIQMFVRIIKEDGSKESFENITNIEKVDNELLLGYDKETESDLTPPLKMLHQFENAEIDVVVKE